MEIEEKPTLYKGRNETKVNELIERLDGWEGLKENKELVKKFIRFCKAERLTPVRRIKYLYILKKLLKWSNFVFDDKNTRDQIIELTECYQGNGFKPSTEADYSICLKKFYKVLFGYNEEYPRCVKWLKTTTKSSEEVKPEYPIYMEDLEKIIGYCKNARNKCIVAVGFDSCCRPSEYLLLKIGDIKPNEHGYEFVIEGKTGVRPIFLTFSSKYLSDWLNQHPERNNKEAYLFINFGNKNYHSFLGLKAANKVLKEAMVSAKIKKTNNLYFLRKSGISYKRFLGLNTAYIEKAAGWVKGSRQMAIYDKLTGFEFKDEIYENAGYSVKNKKTDKTIKDRVCVKCKSKNGFADVYCAVCSFPLRDEDIKEVLKKQESMKENLDILMEIAPKLRKIFEDTNKLNKFKKLVLS